MPVAETFTFADEAGITLGDIARLDTMVTVVDASTFLEECDGVDDLNERGLGLSPEDDRTIVDLLVEQVEFANIVVINKADLVEEDELARTEAVVRALNPAAEILRATRSQVPLGEILDTGRFDLEQAANAPGWLSVMRGDEQPETEEYGIGEWDEETPGQELVFIGAEHIVGHLDSCLLHDDELALGASAWTLLDDPFPAWESISSEQDLPGLKED